MPSGNSPRVILYDQNGDVPLVGSQAVSGSLPVAIANDQIVAVSGTLFTQPVPGVTGSITGSVAVTNRVDISGSAWTPTVTGSVVVSNRVDVTGSVGITAAVTVLPHTITSGSVTGLLVGGVNVSSTNPLPMTGSIGIAAPVAVTQGTSPWVVSGSNWIPTVTGSVIVANQVAVANNSGTFGGQMEGRAPYDSTFVGYPIPVGGYESATGFVRRVSVDSAGRLVTAPSSAVAVRAGFIFGKVDVTTQATALIEHTTYTEQAANARRSLVSLSGSDTLAGTGARVIKITYYDVSGSGPKTDFVSMGGLTPVNTNVTDICYIEKLEVWNAGTYTTNVGNILLKTSVNGTGSNIGSINGSAGQTFWAHHYVASGSTCYITGLFGGKQNNTSAGSGGTFFIKAQSIGTLVSGTVNEQITDFISAYGQANGILRSFGTAITVVGPARLQVYVAPESALTTTYLASADLYEI